jgi:hypothetical protein
MMMMMKSGTAAALPPGGFKPGWFDAIWAGALIAAAIAMMGHPPSSFVERWPTISFHPMTVSDLRALHAAAKPAFCSWVTGCRAI